MSTDVSVKKSVVFTKTDYGGVLLDDRSGEYWQLNATSAVIFAAIQAGLTLEAIAHQVVDSFDGVDIADATADAEALIAQLLAAGIAR